MGFGLSPHVVTLVYEVLSVLMVLENGYQLTVHVFHCLLHAGAVEKLVIAVCHFKNKMLHNLDAELLLPPVLSCYLFLFLLQRYNIPINCASIDTKNFQEMYS